MRRLSKYLSLILILVVLLNLLLGCQPSPTPSNIISTAQPTETQQPTSTTPTSWDGMADPTLWQGGTDYLIESRQDGLFVQANKITERAFMEAIFPAVDIRQYPYASLSALSDISANINVWLVDASGKEGRLIGNAANREMAHGTHPMVHSFDFSKTNIDLSRVTGMRIAFNYGAPSCYAKVLLQDILLGERAVRGLNYSPLPDVEITVGDSPLPIKLYPVSPEDKDAIWTPEFPSEIVQTGTVENGQFIYTLSGKTGNGTVFLNGNKDGRTIRLAFNLTVSENNPPTMDPVNDQIMVTGTVLDLRLTGLDDGDPASAQKLNLTANSQNQDVAKVTAITFDQVSRWAKLQIQSLSSGNSRIDLILTDDRGLSASQSFELSVYPEINRPPTFDIETPLVLKAGDELRRKITAISAGEDDQQVILSAQSDKPALTASIEGNFLILQAAANSPSSAMVIITAKDNGGNENNQGDATFTRIFPVTILQPAITGLTDTFDGPEVDSSLANSGEGAHILTIEEGVLRIEIDKYATNNKWAGLWYALPAELDISQNPIITLQMKADRETSMLIFLWDANDIYNTAGTANVIVGTEWKEYILDFSGKDLDANGRKVDFSRIKSLLFNFAPGMMYKGTFWIDNLKVGDQAGVSAAPPPIEIHTPLQITLMPGGSIQDTFPITGLKDDEQVELDKSDPTFLSSATLTREGELLFLNIEAKPNTSGITRLKIKAGDGKNRQVEKYLDIIIPKNDQTSIIQIDPNSRYQTIDGFGAFLGSQVVDQQTQELMLPFVTDLGITVARFGIINTDFEPQNDNANPYVIDYNGYDTTAIPLDWIRRLKAETRIDKYIVTVWSPPAWMKKSRTLSASADSGENYLEERYYEEYAEYLVALVRLVKEYTDIDLYAISVQNEPQFNEPYPSGLLPAEKMAQLLKVVTQRFQSEGIQTKLYMPEALPAQKGIKEYIRQLDMVPEAGQHVDIIAIHNYDPDGIHVGGAGAQEWADMFQWANAARPRRLWMTETSGHPNTWSGAVMLFGNIYNALVYGNASAWIWWTLSEISANAEYGLVVDNQPTSRYAISRHFYLAAQPGAIRINTASEPNILSVAFQNPDGSIAIVLYNSGATRLVSCNDVGNFIEGWVSQDRYLSRPIQHGDNNFLLPADSVATVFFQP